jgi:hypothetical protein
MEKSKQGRQGNQSWKIPLSKKMFLPEMESGMPSQTQSGKKSISGAVFPMENM